MGKRQKHYYACQYLNKGYMLWRDGFQFAGNNRRQRIEDAAPSARPIPASRAEPWEPDSSPESKITTRRRQEAASPI